LRQSAKDPCTVDHALISRARQAIHWQWKITSNCFKEPEFISLVDELSTLSPEFKKWWNAHQVRRSSSGEKIVRHPKKGGIKLEYSTFQSNDNPDLKLVLYKVEASAGLRVPH
jgi:transcription regulator MmyB-like protein